METINERFRRLRIQCDKSQEEFGKILGLSRSGVSEIESGRRDVNERHIIMLSNWKEVHINIDWLRNGGPDEDMFKVDFEIDELSDYCAEISEGKDPFIADMLLKYKKLSPSHKQAIWEIYEELKKEEG
ncbi:MAG: helix-turn-helix transcriptional regulator [Lachnospiraceae bacterium]|nr:helix-turn-helix transcriptional regulator [Lachnospiraceae bacterium]